MTRYVRVKHDLICAKQGEIREIFTDPKGHDYFRCSHGAHYILPEHNNVEEVIVLTKAEAEQLYVFPVAEDKPDTPAYSTLWEFTR